MLSEHLDLPGVATAVDPRTDGEDPRKPRGRKRRARRRAEAVAQAAVTIPVADEEPHAEAPAPAAAALESVAVAGVRRRERRRVIRRGVERATAAPEPEPVAVGVPEPEPAPEDGFHDLLGQAVGLRLDSVTRTFDTGDMKVVALRDVSVEIAPGEFVSVIGPSGCGKTTLLSLMGGLDRPTSGRVFAAGLALDELSETALADYRLQRAATIFQTFNLIGAMSVLENVSLPLLLAGIGPAERRARALHLLELVGLEGKSRVRASRLSGGEQQKVAIARALANRPGLILADEPTGSLDSAAGKRILDLLKDLNRRGATVVLVTHDPEVARHSNRALRMMDGRAFELESNSRNVRNQDPVMVPPRLHWRDTLRLGLLSAGRRPLRTFLTTTGVAIGIAAMSLIVALSGGLSYALSAPGLSANRLDEVTVRPAPEASLSFDAATISTLAEVQHVKAVWGEVALPGGFSATTAAPSLKTDRLIALAPRAWWTEPPALVAGAMPTSDSLSQVVLSRSEAIALGFTSPAAAVGKVVTFTVNAAKPATLSLLVVGVVSDVAMPGGVTGALAPYQLVRDQWGASAALNGWKQGEFTSITVLADSGETVDGVRDQIEALGFQAESTGDQLRGFEELLGRLRVALLGLSVVALLLACLGIANTMYTAVLERTREIGILKAVGARSRDILLLFVAEAALIGLVGGVLGGVVAAFLSRLGNSAVDALVPPVAGAAVEVFRPDIVVAVAALVLAVLLSMGSGLLPAVRAAAQEPMKALHHE
jgi:ABC-type lipoprotein export system ATPase subunit/ABC-type antimicrobial peptide transport system permease subunit